MSRYLPQKKILQAILLFGVIFNVYAQKNDKATIIKDSIQNLSKSVNDYIRINDFMSAFDYASKAVALAEKVEDKSIRAESYIAIGNAYRALKKLKLAEEYFNKSLNLGEELNDLLVLNKSYSGLSYIQAVLYRNPNKSIEYQNKALEISREVDNPITEVVALMNLIGLNLRYKRINQAEIELKRLKEIYADYEALVASGEADYRPTYHAKYEDLHAKYYRQKKQYEKALTHLKKAEIVAHDNCLYTNIININKGYYNMYNKLGKEMLAKESLLEVIKYENILNDKQKNKQIEIVTAKFELNQYKSELAASENEKAILAKLSKSKSKTIIFSTISIAMLLILLSLMYYSYKKWKSNYELKTINESLEIKKDNAERLTKLKSNFISRVSHEIRTPLHSVIGITSILEEDNAFSKKHQKYIKALKFSGQHLIKLVDTVLDIRQIETQNIQLNITNNDIHAIIKNIVNSFKFQAKESNNILTLNIGKTVSKNYQFDKLRLSEVLINLIENAIKFTVNGTIIITVDLQENLVAKDKLIFKVKDTGEGIKEDNLALIFDDFNQAKEEQNIYKGAGLGLPTVKYLLELMDTSIYLDSKHGEGSTFSFSLILPKADNYIKTSKSKFKKIVSVKKILIVEDNKMSQMVTSKLINLIGYDCIIEENGLQAFERTQQEKFDLILMDLNMPVMNGFESSKKIKAYFPEINIVGLTAADLSKVRDKCINSGMVDVYNKPISKKQLDTVVKKYARKKIKNKDVDFRADYLSIVH